MKQDFLSKALPAELPQVSAEQLPDGQQMKEAVVQAFEIHESLDMIQLTPQERQKIGAPSTQEEMDLNRMYAELTDEHAILLQLLGEAPGAMSQGYEMERALQIYGQANRNLINVSRGAVIICSAALTEDNDKAEEAAHLLSGGTTLTPERRAVIGNVVQALDHARSTQKDAQVLRQHRKDLAKGKQQKATQQIHQRADQKLQLAGLAAAPLPATKTQSE